MITSKEAIEELKFQVGNITYYTHDLQMTTRKVRDSGLFEVIEKDLEIFEILKKNLYYDIDGGISLRIGCKNTNFNKVKELLEK